MTNKQLSESIDDIVNSIVEKKHPDQVITTWFHQDYNVFSLCLIKQLMRQAAEKGYRLAQKEYKK